MGRGGRAGFAGHRVAPPVAGGDLSVPRRARPAAGEAECDQQPPGRRAARDLDGGGGSVPRGTAEAAGERTAGNSGGGQYRRAEERSRVGDCGPSGEERKKKTCDGKFSTSNARETRTLALARRALTWPCLV